MDKTNIPQPTVVPSQAMAAPEENRLLAYRRDPVRPEPPAVHARIHTCAPGEGYALQYNGIDLFTFHFSGAGRPGLRFHSDGDFQSEPFIQQFLTFAPPGTRVDVRISAPVEWWNIRPERAARGQAILGQVGAPLLPGLNGIYLPDWDLLVSWHGASIHWNSDSVQTLEGVHFADGTILMPDAPLVILFRPRYYGEHLGYRYHLPWLRRPKGDAVCGWCSWEAYHDDITLEALKKAAGHLASLRPCGLSIIQLDDGYQQPAVPLYPGADVGESWLRPNEKFPGGHKAITETITGRGFAPGIWINASLTHHDNAGSIGCCLKDPDGELIRGDWIQYILDCSPETLERHVRKCYHALREKGYVYFKVDSIRHLLYDGLEEAVRRGLMDTETARARHRSFLSAAREGMGSDTYFLSCWGVLSSSIGLCDAMRVATDANPSWRAFSMQLRETARWFFAQRVMFTIDPDHVCVRAPLPWVRMMLSSVSLTGGLMMVSDPPETYDPARMALMQRTIPPLCTHTGETGPVDYTSPACAFGPRDMDDEALSRFVSHERPEEPFPMGSLWAIHFRHGGRSWCVVQRCAVTPLPEAVLALDAFALDPGKSYYAYDFWQETAWPVGTALSMTALALGDTQVIALTEVDGAAPVLLGSTRHVSCDAVSVLACGTAENGYELQLSGFPGLEAGYTVFMPLFKGGVCADGARATAVRTDSLVAVRVVFLREKAHILLQ